jgi:predicted DNA-binding transcriptional regulator YafY
MSKTSSLLRQFLLIRKIQKENKSKKFPDLGELRNHVIKELSNRDIDEFGSSELTFKRDIKQITSYFGIPIAYNRKEKGYYIEDYQHNNDIIETVLESFEILTSLGNDGGMPDYVIPEKRKSIGTEHFSYLLSCIKNSEIISFDYFKFDTERTTKPVIKPYALKESQRRWYLLGTIENEDSIRAYGLDRISNLYSIEKKFLKVLTIEKIIEKYKDCFAMFSSKEKPEKIILSYDKRDGNYIKSFPIHHSQKIEKEEENRLTFSFFVKIEPDFLMELLSRTWSVEVIEPLSLRKHLKSIFEDAQSRNT